MKTKVKIILPEIRFKTIRNNRKTGPYAIIEFVSSTQTAKFRVKQGDVIEDSQEIGVGEFLKSFLLGKSLISTKINGQEI